jgi:phosphate-selective porin
MKIHRTRLVAGALAACFATGARAEGPEEGAPPTAPVAAAPAVEVASFLPPPSGGAERPFLPPSPPAGAPASGATARPAEESTLGTLRLDVKLEARLDAGDVAEGPDGATYATGRDAYVKKVRFGVGGRLLARGKYALLLAAEHLAQDGRAPLVKLDRAYVEYAFADPFAVRVGRAKVPLSRGSLLSSNDVLLRDAAVVSAIDKLFVDDTQLALQVKGSAGAGVLSWAAALGEGWRRGDPIHGTAAVGTVQGASPLLVVRAELALPGFAQPLEATAPGRGRRVSIGASLSTQRDIRYAGGTGAEDRSLASLDLTARAGPFSAVVEADAWRVASTAAAVGTKRPSGGYAQLAWFVAGPSLEPAIRYDAYNEDAAEPGAYQRALSLGVNWYPRRDGVKLALDLVRSELGPRSHDRLAQARHRDVVQLGADVSF